MTKQVQASAAFSSAVLSQAPASGVTAIRNLATSGMTPQQIVGALAANAATAPLTQIVPFVLGLGTNPTNRPFGGQSVSGSGYRKEIL